MEAATKCKGSLRSDIARSRIGLVYFAVQPEYSWSGYFSDLHYYGPKSHDSLNMIKRHVSDEVYSKLKEIISKSDSGEI